MVTIGSDAQPGVILEIESAVSVGTDVGAPGLPIIIGQADLDNGNADPDTARRITRPSVARRLFGDADNSVLTQAINDALVDGAYPVYSIAPPEVSVSGEDLSGVSGQTTTLANAPVIERASDITFTVNSTQKDTVLYYSGDPDNATPGTDEVYVNPVTGKAKADESFGNTGDSVDYEYADYSNTFEEITDAAAFGDTYIRELADFIALTNENSSVISDAVSKSESMEQNGWFNIVLAGAGSPYIDDHETSTDEVASYTDSYDTSRLQLINPSRARNGETLIGGYVGDRSDAGITRSPVFDRISTHTDLLTNLRDGQIETLISENVIPIEERSSGARIVEDVTTVVDDNTDEAAWRSGFARLVTDYVAEVAEAEAEPFIGEFNNRAVRNALRGKIEGELGDLLDSRVINAYSLGVSAIDDNTAAVDIGIDTADALKNIEATVAAGDVRNGVSR